MINSFRLMRHFLSKNFLFVTLFWTIFLVILVQTLHIPNPAIIYTVIIVFFTFKGGYRYGAISGLITFTQCVYFFSQPARLAMGMHLFIERIIVIFVSFAALVLMVGKLKERNETHTCELENLSAKFRLLSTIDGLTGVFNRRCFEDLLAYEWEQNGMAKHPLALIMIDVDYFKRYNDTHGHQAGDVCLQKIAETMAKHIRHADDHTARYGGEEFSILLSNANITQALKKGEEIRLAIENLKLPHGYSDVSPYVTISIGVMAVIPQADANNAEELIHKADKALYYAKEHGRNRVIPYSSKIENAVAIP